MYIVASLGGSLVLGVAALAVARFWNPPAPKPSAVAAAPVNTLKPVVVTTEALAYGAKLEPGKLTVRYMPKDAVPDGAFATVAEVMARDGGAPLILTPMAGHEALLPAKVSGAGARVSVATQITEGMRAYAVAITDKSGVGGNALPGDWVDVVLAVESAPTAGKRMMSSEVVIQNVRVLGIDRNANPASTETALPSTATLEVKLEDTQKLALASMMGTLSLALRKTGSADVAPVHLIRASAPGLSDLPAAASGAPRPARASRAGTGVVQAQAAPAVLEHVISIRSGDTQSRVTVPQDRNLIVLGAR